jgi:hypothetical protein
MTFVEKCVNGLVKLEEVDDYVEEWHRNSEHHHESLREFLGMTQKEFGRWLREAEALREIIKEHKIREEPYLTTERGRTRVDGITPLDKIGDNPD